MPAPSPVNLPQPRTFVSAPRARRPWLAPLALLAGALLLTGGLAAQQVTPLAAEWERVHERLRALPRPTVAERVQVLRDFVTVHADDDHREVLQARLALGRALLHALDAAGAATELAAVAEKARAHEPELRGAGLYGLQQAQRLQGDARAANATLQALAREFEGKELGDCARIALAQAAHPQEPAVGKALPQLQPGRDVRGREVGTAEGPRLLVFWSMEHAPSERRLVQLAREWQKAGMAKENLIAYALESDERALLRLAEQREYGFAIVPGQRGFLHPDWLQLSVTAVPTVLLIGVDGTLIARDVTPDRLASLLQIGR